MTTVELPLSMYSAVQCMCPCFWTGVLGTTSYHLVPTKAPNYSIVSVAQRCARWLDREYHAISIMMRETAALFQIRWMEQGWMSLSLANEIT